MSMMSKESALLHRCCISCGSGGATRSSSVPCSFCIPFFFFLCCCLRCLASLHHQPQSEPSIISLTNTHTQCQHSSFDASRIHMEWKYGKNRVLFFSSFFFLLLNFTPADSPWRPPPFSSPAPCACCYEEQICQKRK